MLMMFVVIFYNSCFVFIPVMIHFIQLTTFKLHPQIRLTAINSLHDMNAHVVLREEHLDAMLGILDVSFVL